MFFDRRKLQEFIKCREDFESGHLDFTESPQEQGSPQELTVTSVFSARTGVPPSSKHDQTSVDLINNARFVKLKLVDYS